MFSQFFFSQKVLKYSYPQVARCRFFFKFSVRDGKESANIVQNTNIVLQYSGFSANIGIISQFFIFSSSRSKCLHRYYDGVLFSNILKGECAYDFVFHFFDKTFELFYDNIPRSIATSPFISFFFFWIGEERLGHIWYFNISGFRQSIWIISIFFSQILKIPSSLGCHNGVFFIFVKKGKEAHIVFQQVRCNNLLAI